jgi:hypothetical protein
MNRPPEPFIWEQRDAMKVRCTECGEVVKVSVCDLHTCAGGR